MLDGQAPLTVTNRAWNAARGTVDLKPDVHPTAPLIDGVPVAPISRH
jgi:hypothetical protein